MQPRTMKILRDLWINLPRSILVVLAIAIGVFGTGLVIDAYSVLNREIDANYKMANPASAKIWMNKVDVRAVNLAKSFPGVTQTDASYNLIRARVEVSKDNWNILQLYVIDDFNNITINKFFPDTGAWPPADGQILIERASLPIINATTGNKINIRVVGSPITELTVGGTVFDPNQEPAWVNNIVCGYITPGTLKLLGAQAPASALRIALDNGSNDRSTITSAANSLGSVLQKQGYQVSRIEVPIPGKYSQTDKINSLLLTLVFFGLLCLVLSSLITASLISGLLSQQIRQIGIMKALGANTRQIMGVYMTTVLILTLAALGIGIPLGAAAGEAFASSTMDLLNFNIYNNASPVWAIALQATIGIFIPLFTALFPVLRGSRITVREAVSNSGVNLQVSVSSRTDKFLENIRFLPRLLAISLRNTFRRKGRLALSLIMLTLGGALFIASLGSAASWNSTIDHSFSRISYDIDIRLGSAYPIKTLENTIRSVPGVSVVEAWGYTMSSCFPEYNDGTFGSAYAVFAPSNNTSFINPPVTSGRWIDGSGANDMVLDTDFIDNAAKQGTPVHVGDDITFSISGKNSVWHVVGIMDKIGFQSAAYVNYQRLSAVTNQQGMASCARVAVQNHDKVLQNTVAQSLEQKLGQDGISVFAIQDLSLTRQIMINHVVLILSLLMFMSILVAVVGALGLASAIGMNVLERTREIGVMRTIGATSRTIMQAIILEGMIIAFISWILSIIVSVPLTILIASNTGQFVFPSIMVISYPAPAPFLWLGIVIGVAAAASYGPARRATRLTIHEVLSFE